MARVPVNNLIRAEKCPATVASYSGQPVLQPLLATRAAVIPLYSFTSKDSRFQGQCQWWREGGGRRLSVPQLDLAVPAAREQLRCFVGMPRAPDANAVVSLELAVHLGRLPVPDADLPVAVTGCQVRHVGGEGQLARVTCDLRRYKSRGGQRGSKWPGRTQQTSYSAKPWRQRIFEVFAELP